MEQDGELLDEVHSEALKRCCQCRRICPTPVHSVRPGGLLATRDTCRHISGVAAAEHCGGRFAARAGGVNGGEGYGLPRILWLCRVLVAGRSRWAGRHWLAADGAAAFLG